MTEAEWEASNSPRGMIYAFMGGGLGDRKLRLFACACCHRIWHLLTDPRSRRAVEASEQYADEIGSLELLLHTHQEAWKAQEIAERGEAKQAAMAAYYGSYPRMNWDTAETTARDAVYALRPQATPTPEERAVSNSERRAQCDLLRDIFGNPFRPTDFSPDWRTDTAVALAHTMYESREFSAMTILADALQDAGCDNLDVLSHCRGAGPHVRGCWVVDLVLGKE